MIIPKIIPKVVKKVYTVNPIEVQRLDNISNDLAKAVSGPKVLRSPLVNGSLSQVDAVYYATQKLYSTGSMEIKGRLKDDDNFVPLESKMLEQEGSNARMIREIDKTFAEDLKVDADRAFAPIRNAADAKRQGKLGQAEREREIYLTFARKQKDGSYVNPNPTIEKAAQILHSNLKPRFQDNVKARLLVPEQEQAWYIPRSHIKTNWAKVTDSQVIKMAQEAVAIPGHQFKNLDEAVKVIKAMRTKVLNGEDGDSTLYLMNKAAMEGEPINPIQGVGKSGEALKDSFTKALDKRLDTELLAKYDLIETNATDVTSRYLYSTQSVIQVRNLLIHMGEKFGLKGGFANIGELKKFAKQQIEIKLAEAEKSGMDGEGLARFREDMTDDVDNVMDGLFKLHLGTIRERGPISDHLQALRTYTLATTMGGVLIGSITDLAGLPFRQGYANILRDGIAPLLADIVAHKGALYKSTQQELADAGISLDLIMNQGLKQLTDADTVGRGAYRTFNDGVMYTFGRVTGIGFWNNTMKIIAGHTFTMRLMRTIENHSKGIVDADEIAKLKKLGIHEEDFKGILEEFNKPGHGAKEGDQYLLNLRDWEEGVTRDKVMNALQVEVNASILSPSAAMKPLMFSRSDIGMLVGQLKSFPSAATSQILISGLQRRDATVVAGASNMIMLGYVSYAIKEVLAGREPSTDMDRVIREGLSRSGLLGLFMDSLLSIVPGGTGSRYASGSLLDKFAGPAAGKVNDFYKLATGVVKDGYDSNDAAIVKRLTLYQNLFYLSPLLNKAYGVEPPKPQPASQGGN